MSKLDNIFQKVIADKALAEKYGIVPDRYQTITQGNNAMNPYVKYVARTLYGIDKEVEDVKERMRQQYKTDAVKLSEDQLKTIYKVSLPILNVKEDDN